MIQSEGLTYQYAGSQKLSFPDISIEGREDLLILGKSGVGKTTLLHLLGGLLRPQNGTLSISNQLINELNDAQLDRFRGRELGFIFQTAHFISSLTVEENLKLALHLSSKKVEKNRIHELLGELGILKHKNKLPSRLSIGEQQRLSIARALVHQPSVLLADEPTSSLDDDHCADVIELLKAEAERYQVSLIVVTHDSRLKSAFTKYIEL